MPVAALLGRFLPRLGAALCKQGGLLSLGHQQESENHMNSKVELAAVSAGVALTALLALSVAILA
jgi:hypothetical protein